MMGLELTLIPQEYELAEVLGLLLLMSFDLWREHAWGKEMELMKDTVLL